jgi:hypothetical protein
MKLTDGREGPILDFTMEFALRQNVVSSPAKV